jgi:glycosyltransferase involved in cell wall biosynthesis
MKTTVIIPAFNEGAYIGETLHSLPADFVNPIVAVNGSSDETASIAESFGATVMNFEQQGKLPAIQQVLRHLGREALEPLMILDADTHPIMPRAWRNKMIQLLTVEPESPAVIGGPLWYDEAGIGCNAARWLIRCRTAYIARGGRVGQAGPNMGLYIQNEATLDKILALPHYWPGEDRAMIREIQSSGGTYTQPLNLTLHTVTRIPKGMPPLLKIVRSGHKAYQNLWNSDYENRSAPGSVPAKIV